MTLLSDTLQPTTRMHDAATVVLVRDAGSEGVEVLLTRRHHGMAFMAGVFVFPGGKLDGGDCAPGLQQRLPRHFVRDLVPVSGQPLSAEKAAGLYVAAIREVFEEVGLLLVQPALAWSTPPVQSCYQRLRADLLAGRCAFADVLAVDNLQLDTHALRLWSHWITPSSEPRRYDTRFFLAACPPQQEPMLHLGESTEMAWLTPQAALARYRQGSLSLSPPTYRTLEEMLPFASTAALQRQPRHVAAVVPKLVMANGEITLYFPWDKAYPGLPGEGDAYENPQAEVSRMQTVLGVWHSL